MGLLECVLAERTRDAVPEPALARAAFGRRNELVRATTYRHVDRLALAVGEPEAGGIEVEVVVDAPCAQPHLGLLVHLLHLEDSCERGGATVGDALFLLPPSEAEHRVEPERAAQPLRFHGHDMKVEQVGRGIRAMDEAEVGLCAGERVDLAVVFERVRAFCYLKAVSDSGFVALPRGIELEGGRKNEVRYVVRRALDVESRTPRDRSASRTCRTIEK